MSIAQLALRTLRKQTSYLIAFGIVFGLRIQEFFVPLWNTANISAASAHWVAIGLPQIPGAFAMLTLGFTIALVWEVGVESQKHGYADRADGYRPHSDD